VLTGNGMTDTSGDEPQLGGQAQPGAQDVGLGGDSGLIHALEYLNHEDPAVRQRTAHMLAKTGSPHAYNALHRLFTEGERGIRLRALRALGKLSDPRVFDLLIEALEHEAYDVRRTAIHLLATRGDSRAIFECLSNAGFEQRAVHAKQSTHLRHHAERDRE
jgi:HEAT repeat protein